MCDCSKAAILLTTRKEGDNFGRKFYKCDAQINKIPCKFFEWEDKSEGTQTQCCKKCVLKTFENNFSMDFNKYDFLILKINGN